MSQQISPFIEGKFGWNLGESGWNSGMDENLLKFSYLFDRNVDGIVSSLPTTPSNGSAYFLTTDNRLYFRVAGNWLSSPTPKWFIITVRATGELHKFTGSSLVVVESSEDLGARLDAVELQLSQLGTASLKDEAYFATQAGLDVVEASSQSYTDAEVTNLTTNLTANGATTGASFVTKSTVAIPSMVDLLVVKKDTTQIFNVGSYHPTLNIGGGSFRWEPSVAKSGHNGGTIISPTVPWDGSKATVADFIMGVGETDSAGLGVFVKIVGGQIGVCEFGAVSGDANFDNRVPFQRCIDTCSQQGKTFLINPTEDSVFYDIKSFNPDTTNGNNCLIITKVRNFHAVGYRKRNANVRYSGLVDGVALIRVLSPTSDWGLKLDELGLDAGGKLDHLVLATNTWYALSRIEGGTYANAKLDGIRVSLYMSELAGIHSAGHGRDAFAFVGPDDQGGPTTSTTTSLTVTSCWARLCGRYGFSVENPIWYSNFISCGVDGGAVTGAIDRFTCAYRFFNTHGLTLAACGAEKVDQYFHCDTFTTLKIDNPKGTDIGPTTGQSLAMIFLAGGFDAQVTNIPNGLFQSAKFQYAIASNANTGNEKIDIFGGYIERSQCYFTPSADFKQWPDVYYFPGHSGVKADRAKLLVGSQLYNGPLAMGGRPTERTYVHNKVVDLVSSVASPQIIDLLEVSGNLSTPTFVKVNMSFAKYAGSPTPTIGTASFEGTAYIASSTKTGGAMTKVHGDAYTASLVWSADKLTLECAAQYAVFFISIEFWGRTAFVKFL